MLLLLACNSDGPGPSAPGTDTPRAVGPEPLEIPEAPANDSAELFYGAYLDEALGVDVGAARRTYQVVAGSEAAEPNLVSRANLRLAPMAAASGDTQLASEHLARAMAAAGGAPTLVARVDRLRAELTTRAQAGPGRGPPISTRLEGVSPAIAASFAEVERELAAYYRRPLTPRLGGLEGTLNANQRALAGLVRGYAEVANQARVAAVAGNLRVAVAYHDSALALFDTSQVELAGPQLAAVRGRLRRRAVDYLGRSRTAYQRTLEIAGALDGDAATAASRWRVAAEQGLSALDRLKRF
ncbi:MAG: hypothetical protein KJO07_20955 [Deltaproteobacteria bacterium]|nr:hypothetical protein [Deltaproteobacteria bacterium]